MGDLTDGLGKVIAVHCVLIFAAGAGFALLVRWLWHVLFG